MRSPFPGMDPYLEDPAFWRDFHLTFIGCWREAIADLLPAGYEARLDETIHIVPLADEVISRGRRRPVRKARRATASTALLDPVVIPHELTEEVRQARIEILHRPERTLVTVLELLSPTNKTGEGFGEFCAKRQMVLRQKNASRRIGPSSRGRASALARTVARGGLLRARLARRSPAGLRGVSLVLARPLARHPGSSSGARRRCRRRSARRVSPRLRARPIRRRAGLWQRLDSARAGRAQGVDNGATGSATSAIVVGQFDSRTGKSSRFPPRIRFNVTRSPTM